MKKVFKQLFCALFIVPPVSHATAIKITHEYPQIRRAPLKKIQEYFTNKDFIYDKDYTPDTGLWDRIKRWIEDRLFQPLFKHHSITILDLMIYAIAVAAILLIIYYLLQSETSGLFTGKPGNTSLDISTVNEDIHQLDFDK